MDVVGDNKLEGLDDNAMAEQDARLRQQEEQV